MGHTECKETNGISIVASLGAIGQVHAQLPQVRIRIVAAHAFSIEKGVRVLHHRQSQESASPRGVYLMDQILLYWHEEIHPRRRSLLKILLFNLIGGQGGEPFLPFEVFQPPRTQLDEVLSRRYLGHLLARISLSFLPGHRVGFGLVSINLLSLALLVWNIAGDGVFILCVVQVVPTSEGVIDSL